MTNGGKLYRVSLSGTFRGYLELLLRNSEHLLDLWDVLFAAPETVLWV